MGVVGGAIGDVLASIGVEVLAIVGVELLCGGMAVVSGGSDVALAGRRLVS